MATPVVRVCVCVCIITPVVSVSVCGHSRSECMCVHARVRHHPRVRASALPLCECHDSDGVSHHARRWVSSPPAGVARVCDKDRLSSSHSSAGIFHRDLFGFSP